MIIITSGEPAGIGPDLLIQFAQTPSPEKWVALADPDLLIARAKLLGLPIQLHEWPIDKNHLPTKSGDIIFIPLRTHKKVIAGKLAVENVPYVLQQLTSATRLCLEHSTNALLTLPVHKGIISASGINFRGHTEFFAQLTQTSKVVMMLAAKQHRVALATTHLPLREVPSQITATLLQETIDVLYQALKNQFQIADPIIDVCGLNPHAGEDGYLGREEIDTIIPIIEKYQQQQQKIRGPFAADTLFNFDKNKGDAFLAMYHDQGLTPLKSRFFGEVVNISLGLPFTRTSVDHGTALSLAGSGKASMTSLQAAFQQTLLMMKNNDANICA